MKECYIRSMEKVLEAYSFKDIQDYVADIEHKGICEHGFPRLTANIGILIAHKKRTDLTNIFLKMMDLCCDQMPGIMKIRKVVGNDFSVKEIVFCILELEKSNVFHKSVTEKWRKQLAAIDPYSTYDKIASVPPQRISNWAAFGAASEQVRKMAGIGDESSFIENQVLSQLFSFDENGMYRDPDEPMVYDMVTRLQLATALFCGYDGKGKEQLEQALIKSAMPTLLMQSTTGEIPFGGRSNQFLHNEAFYAALCEFYASFYKRRGELTFAGQFKRAAKLAMEHVLSWLEKGDTIYHIKNYYDRSTKYGCERYAYFNKYMITTASWLYLAYYMADDTILEQPCPVETGNYFWQTGSHFHKTFCKFAEYYIEIETKANYMYDASGIGRIQYKGAPNSICCATPFAKEPNYTLDVKNPSPLSISGGINKNNEWHYAWEEDVEYHITEMKMEDDCATISMDCIMPDKTIIQQMVAVTKECVVVTAKGNGGVALTLPVFEFDGKNKTKIEEKSQEIKVCYKGWSCSYVTDGSLMDTGLVYGNRNGHYKRFDARGVDKVTVKIFIKPNGSRDKNYV